MIEDDKWMIAIELQHGYKNIKVETEGQARELYGKIRDALADGSRFIDVDGALISLGCVEMVRIEPPFREKMTDIPLPCDPPYEPVRKIDIPKEEMRTKNTPTVGGKNVRMTSVTHNLTNAERDLFEKMMESDDLSEERLVRRMKK